MPRRSRRGGRGGERRAGRTIRAGLPQQRRERVLRAGHRWRGQWQRRRRSGTVRSARRHGFGHRRGKFANGAVTSAFSYALNQAMQKTEADRLRDALKTRKVIVIGEGMKDRVIPFADGIGADIFRPSRWYDPDEIDLLFKENMAWINEKWILDTQSWTSAQIPGTAITPCQPVNIMLANYCT